MFGKNETAAPITAIVTSADLRALVTAINNAYRDTNITAEIDPASNNSEIILREKTGANIKITKFTHSSAIKYVNPYFTPVPCDNSGYILSPVIVTILAKGNVTTNIDANGKFAGDTVRLTAGGTDTINAQNSIVVGGHITFRSPVPFCMTSSIDGSRYHGSLFNSSAMEVIAAQPKALKTVRPITQQRQSDTMSTSTSTSSTSASASTQRIRM